MNLNLPKVPAYQEAIADRMEQLARTHLAAAANLQQEARRIRAEAARLRADQEAAGHGT